ncbi:hypothetical protein ANN_03988 [Periplaneta americana]|uniref:Uncharacterized protein n=1 Tax=Periplaneta americana TaxID=6978 RepID=A0ABQ8T961_PERAM|nr:hypothetical protein ANN_03988 [Periplaneta americana]
MSLGSNTESYPAFAHIGLRENPGKNLNQITCPDRESNPGPLVSRLDALTVTPQLSDIIITVSALGYFMSWAFLQHYRSDVRPQRSINLTPYLPLPPLYENTANTVIDELKKYDWIRDLAFLTDIYEHYLDPTLVFIIRALYPLHTADKLLVKEDNPYINHTRNLQAEITNSLRHLPLNVNDIGTINPRNICKQLRVTSYHQWSALCGKSKDVHPVCFSSDDVHRLFIHCLDQCSATGVANKEYEYEYRSVMVITRFRIIQM